MPIAIAANQSALAVKNKLAVVSEWVQWRVTATPDGPSGECHVSTGTSHTRYAFELTMTAEGFPLRLAAKVQAVAADAVKKQ